VQRRLRRSQLERREHVDRATVHRPPNDGGARTPHTCRRQQWPRERLGRCARPHGLPVETDQAPYSLFSREIEGDVLPYAHEHEIAVLAYGPLAHGLLSGALDEHTTFEPDDWRSRNPSFAGDRFHRNLETVRELQRFATQELGRTISQLALAWTLANPAVQVAIVGAQHARHVEDAVAATSLQLGEHELKQIDRIMAGATAFTGPAPEMMPTA
jgi:aryl-alcohol dehydrogenase-like predicted oxidoreductase